MGGTSYIQLLNLGTSYTHLLNLGTSYTHSLNLRTSYTHLINLGILLQLLSYFGHSFFPINYPISIYWTSKLLEVTQCPRATFIKNRIHYNSNLNSLFDTTDYNKILFYSRIHQCFTFFENTSTINVSYFPLQVPDIYQLHDWLKNDLCMKHLYTRYNKSQGQVWP